MTDLEKILHGWNEANAALMREIEKLKKRVEILEGVIDDAETAQYLQLLNELEEE